METLIGIVGTDFVVMAADATSARSILLMRDDVQKIRDLDGNKLMAAVGDSADRDMFCEFVEKNVTLYRLRTGISLSTAATAHWTRRKLATALRKGPYQCDILIAGFNSEGQIRRHGHELSDSAITEPVPSLYYLDYLASMNKLDFAVHGYGSNFILGILDKLYRPDMNLEEVLGLLRTCLNELKTRFIIKAPVFTVKVVDRNGARSLETISV